MPVQSGPPPEQPLQSPAQPSGPAAGGAPPKLQKVTYPKGYPKFLVKGDHRRQVPDAAEEHRLRFQGWRAEDEPAPERGSFLPSPTTAPAEGEADAAAAADPSTTHARPVRPRRKS